MAQTTAASWQVRAEEKRKRIQALVPDAWMLRADVTQSLQRPLAAAKNNLIELDIARRSGILSARELDITEGGYDVARLLAALAAGDLTALEVTVAFCKRAAIAQQLTSCLTEVLFEQAQERARHLDALRAQGRLAGPLHGLPISIKDGFQVKGTEATLGFVAYLDHGPSHENSCLVDVLLQQGAVLYCKTNVPQTLMTADSENNIFGRTLNPWNTSLTAGGSSGGEGALVAFRGSPLGVGTDVAGSVRIPAVCCGLYGFKPTATRVPFGKQAPLGNPGLKHILASAGPLANDFGALEIFMKAVLDARPARFDATALDVPWNPAAAAAEVEGKPKLRFGVLAEDPLFPLQPHVKRGLAEVVARLDAQGHETVRLTPDEGNVAKCWDVAMQLFALDKSSAALVLQSGEPFVQAIVAGRAQTRGIRFDRAFVPDTRTLGDGLDKLALLNVTRALLQEGWWRTFVSRGLDAVVAPGAGTSAIEHDEYGPAPYTSLLNFLDYPACVIPFGKATKSHLAGEYKPGPGTFAPPYNPENLEGAPLTVQVFTTRMRDEACLAISKVVDTCLQQAARKADEVPSAKI